LFWRPKATRTERGTPFLLDYDCACANLRATDQITNLYGYDVAAAKLAIDRKVEQRSIS
jgi:hypothetical protein